MLVYALVSPHTDSRLSYVAGDHVAIYPVNDAERVARIGELLNTDLDTVVTLTNVDGELTNCYSTLNLLLSCTVGTALQCL